jgi:hypothetical protein
MSTSKETAYYMELQPGEAVQNGDQWRDSFGQWQPYASMGDVMGIVGYDVRARRPIGTTHQTALEEVPGSGTTQQAMDQPQRERIAYEELQPGDVIQAGDEWRNPDGRWHPLVVTPGASLEVRGLVRTRRPYKISTILEIGDALANAQNAAMQLQDERDEAQADVQTLSTALKSVQRARDELQLQVDELRAGLMGVVSAEHVHSMLQEMLDETEWVGQCLGASSYEQMSCIQRTISVILQRVSDME